MSLEQEYAKIPLKCMHPKYLFESTLCNSKMYWEWIQKHKANCPKVCPKYRESR
jgi:hypothetical protein